MVDDWNVLAAFRSVTGAVPLPLAREQQHQTRNSIPAFSFPFLFPSHVITVSTVLLACTCVLISVHHHQRRLQPFHERQTSSPSPTSAMSDSSSDISSIYNINSIYDTAIDRLHADSDFYTWKLMVTNHLKRFQLWDIVSGTTPRRHGPPDAPCTREQEAWDQGALQAECFHHHDPDSLLRTFRAISALRYTEAGDESIADYVGSFERH